MLLFRFRKLASWTAANANPDRSIEPRLNQIFLPLLSIIEDPNDREEMEALARRYHGEMIAERGMDLEAQILEVIRDLGAAERMLSVKDITSWLQDRHGEDYERKITPKWEVCCAGNCTFTRAVQKTATRFCPKSSSNFLGSTSGTEL